MLATLDSHVDTTSSTLSEARPRGPALLRAMRPRQWPKNLLVVAAPAAANVLHEPGALPVLALAVVAFTLVASATYLLNDLLDADADRLHPRKRERPLTSGQLGRRAAVLAGLSLLAAGLVMASWMGGPTFLVVLAIYFGLNVAYSVVLKSVPVLELLLVASGYILRAISGAYVVDVPLSAPFLVVTSFGALLLVLGKRSSELVVLGKDAKRHRRVLGAYDVNVLRRAHVAAAFVTLIAYCAWAIEKDVIGFAGPPWLVLSVAPFVVGAWRHGRLARDGRAGEPESLLATDRPLLVSVLAWAVLVALGIP